MDNNDILRRIRYAFDFSDTEMMNLFAKGDYAATRAEISDWMKQEDNEAYVGLYDKQLASFLNGLIIEKRGSKPGPPPKAEKTLNNNIILRKLKIALNLRDDGMLDVFNQAEFKVSKHEISAFFRKPTQSQYRNCKDQFLRNFIIGMQKKYRKTVN